MLLRARYGRSRGATRVEHNNVHNDYNMARSICEAYPTKLNYNLLEFYYRYVYNF